MPRPLVPIPDAEALKAFAEAVPGATAKFSIKNLSEIRITFPDNSVTSMPRQFFFSFASELARLKRVRAKTTVRNRVLNAKKTT